MLQTNVCGTAVVALPLQDYPEGRIYVGYASWTLNSQERKYFIYELEALTVLHGVENFRVYLEHADFLLQSDSQALSWVLTRTRKSGRLARFVLGISAIKFSVELIRGSQNIIADSLSRMFEGTRMADALSSYLLVIILRGLVAYCVRCH